jgi:hypothetical protein
VVSDGSQEVIITAAFKMDLVFVTQKAWFDQTISASFNAARRLVCSQSGQQECCSADAINGVRSKADKREKKQYCTSNGCCKCPSNKKGRVRQLLDHNRNVDFVNERILIEEDLFGTDFNDILVRYTDLDPIESGAVLDATSVEDVAVCRGNNYNATENGSPTLTCGEYKEAECKINDYYVVNDTKSNETCIVSQAFFLKEFRAGDRFNSLCL